ncbi:phage portal protein [Wolbachia endosymbiont of Cimex lectularius]|uniref:phage portal protein n=1 Tax=Wolbachia endosymbiont of Cimex lectularius TaxID=246273 RepID=UPI00049AE213|nr:phage portal protein [Wolbachia endosymbiont of Cimex lectularius]BAP00253.1 phage portal protein HK97 family [Wolbachia endosymbiont of Cimex lectularius]
MNLNIFQRRKAHKYSALQLIMEPSWSERSYASFAEEGYVKNVIAFRAINMIANAASSVPFILYRLTNQGKSQLKVHPLLKLLYSPSPITSKSEFIEGIVTHRLISGNAYVLMIEPKNNRKPPTELYLLRPDRVEIVPGRNNVPYIYRYTVNNNSYDFKVNKLTGRSAVLHLKTFNPLSDWYGLSPIEAAAYSIDQHNQAGAWNQAMLQNGARPSGAIIVKPAKDGSSGNLSQEQYQRLKEQISDHYSGSVNAGRPILLEGGLEWKEMSLSPRDMDFIESKHSSARDIALAFGVPPQLLGIPGDNTYSNLVEARLSLWEQTVLPTLENIVCHLNSWLTPRFGEDLCLSYDKDAIEILMEKRQKLWKYVENASFMTLNEKREAFGLPPLPGGDELD